MTQTAEQFITEMQESGWELVQMGGGCEQFRLAIDTTAAYRLTDGDFGPPLNADEPCTLICEQNHGKDGGYVLKFGHVWQALRFINDTTSLPWEDATEAAGWTFVQP